MKKLKKLSAILVVVLVLFSAITTTAFAADVSQDGLEVSLITNKEAYEQGDQIEATLTVKNANDFAVKNVTLESLIPDGYVLAEGASATKELNSLEPGETAELAVTFIAKGETPTDPTNPTDPTDPTEPTDPTDPVEPTEPDEPVDSDFTDNGVWKIVFPIMGVTGFVAIIIALAHFKKILALILAAIIGGSFITGGLLHSKAVSEQKSISITETVMVNSEEKEISANVYYKLNNSDDYEAILSELDKIKDLNNGELPEMTYNSDDGTVQFIDDTYSNVTVTDFDSAIKSLKDIKHLMCIDNVTESFKGEDLVTDETYGVNHYKLKQCYNDIPVYANEVIVTTDLNGKTICFTGGYTGNIDIDTKPQISEQQALNIVSKDYEGRDVSSNGLCIYTLTDKNYLTYAVSVGDKFNGEILVDEVIFVSAEDGSIVGSSSKTRNEAVMGRGQDISGTEREFVVEKEDNTYYMADMSKGIAIFTCNNTKNSCDPITSTDNTWTNRDSVSLMNNLSYAVNFYRDTLKTNAFRDGKLSKIIGYVQYKSGDENSYSDTPGDKKTTFLRFGDAYPYVNGLDVVAHEFTHSVISATCDLEYLNQSGAINESYADILGNLIENDNDNVWLMAEDVEPGGIRNLTNPNEFKQPEKVNGKYMHSYCNKNHKHKFCDKGGVHTNSGIVNHAAYLMWQNGIRDKVKLAKVFSKSMDYMVKTTDFLGCRAAVLRAARDLNLTTNEITIIANAFSEVGIKNPSTGILVGNLLGKVVDSETNEGIIDAKITAEQTIAGSGSMRLTTTYTNTKGEFALLLRKGIYTLNVSISGYETYTIENVKIDDPYLSEKVHLDDVHLVRQRSGEGGDGTQENPEIPSTATEFNGHYYQVYDEGMTWTEAKAYCESLGGHLVTITSEEEQKFVNSMLGKATKNSYWLGAEVVDNKFAWVTGEDFSYTNWAYMQPDHPNYEHALMAYRNKNPNISSKLGEWNDLSHNGTFENQSFFGLNNFGFICEWDKANTEKTCLTSTKCNEFTRYTGNVGDSNFTALDKSYTLHPTGTYYGYTNTGVDGKQYNNGFCVWIARWNFGDKISWAQAKFDLAGKYKTLQGSSALLKSYNTSKFNTTVYFYDGDKLLHSFTMTPENCNFDFSVNVTGVDELTVLVKDNMETAGGTSFALYDMFLT